MLEIEILDPVFIHQFLKIGEGETLHVYGPHGSVDSLVRGLRYLEFDRKIEHHKSIDSNETAC